MLYTNSNIANVALNYLQKLKIPVTKTSLKDKIQTNPYYPSLYSLSNVFDRLNIDNTAYRVEKEKLDEIHPPFIAFLKQPTGRDFVVVTSISESEVKYITNTKREASVSKTKFLKDWDSTVLFAEANEQSGERDYVINRKKEKIQQNKALALTTGGAFTFIAIIFTFLNTLLSAQIIAASALVIIKSLGLTVTTLLLIFEIDKSNSFVKSICTAGKQTNCNAVLQSKGAKVFGMNWSEAGFFYFAASFLFLLFPGVTFLAKVCLLSIANCLAAPYILFSIYYQWKVVKQWCPLCLTVQAVLILELIWGIINYWQHPYLPIVSFTLFTSIILSILLPLVSWLSLKSLFIRSKDEPLYKAAYKRLLYNPETFNTLLQQQSTAPNGHENLGITIGNPDAANTIIKVCNPYCGPCAKAHPVLEEIIHNNKNVKLKIIFSVTNSERDPSGIVAKHLLAINAKNNTEQTERALDDWYLGEKNDYSLFAAKYPMNGELNEQQKQIEAMNEWCKEAEIKGTPTLFINGHRLPETYKIDELKYIL